MARKLSFLSDGFQYTFKPGEIIRGSVSIVLIQEILTKPFAKILSDINERQIIRFEEFLETGNASFQVPLIRRLVLFHELRIIFLEIVLELMLQDLAGIDGLPFQRQLCTFCLHCKLFANKKAAIYATFLIDWLSSAPDWKLSNRTTFYFLNMK